jgi:carbon monoxide dehydrogenase subunit G
MIHFDGTEVFPQPPATLFGPLSDAGWLAAAVPDAEIDEATPERAVWKLKPKLSFLTGALETTLAVQGRVPNESVTFKVNGKAVGSGSTVVATLAFAPTETGGTNVKWTGEITELNGLLKMVPKGLIQATAQKIIADVWAAIRVKLS